MESQTIHERFLMLKDVALGSVEEGNLVRLGYDCVLDSLLAVYHECQKSTSLSKDKYISRFLKKYKQPVEELEKLILKENDFETKGIIGQGHFGEVRVVREKSTDEIFAMKVMKKNHILQQADAAFFLEERDIMALGCSPWLTKLHYAFQDEHSLYLVMDFHPGGDLFTIVERKEGGMSEKEARFYLVEIIAGLHDLHKLGFAHRDVKPDNVLITRSGHIKLVDFGSASRLDKDGYVIDSALPVGTPEYISPEVLTSLDGKMKYGVCCDWWSVGIILFELLFDFNPFEGESMTETYANIMNFKSKLSFPEEGLISSEAKHLINNLIVESKERLQYKDIIRHPFFNNTDWNNLRSVIPPFVPAIRGPDDMSYFDKFEPKEDDSADLVSSMKNARGFTGKNLPFVGFTFAHWTTTLEEKMEHASTSQSGLNILPDLDNMAQDIRKALESCQKELKSTQEQKSCVEKDCIVYKSQLEDLHRKLELERKERRMSDSKALQLLAEVREQSKLAQEMRESKTREMGDQIQGAVTQLEQERTTALKRLQRTQEELKKKLLELDNVTAKVSDLRSKLAHVKESSKNDIASLQSKLNKVTEDSRNRIAELHKDYAELQEKYSNTMKEMKSLEDSHRKLVNEMNALKLNNTLAHDSTTDVGNQLTISDKEQERLQSLLAEKERVLEMEREQMKQFEDKYQELTLHTKIMEEQLKSLTDEKEKMEANEWSLKQNLESTQEEVRHLHEEKTKLMSTCEELSYERDSKTQLLQKHENNIEMLSHAKMFLEKKIEELEQLALQETEDDKRITANEISKVMEKQLTELQEERSQLKETMNKLELDLSEKDTQLETLKSQQPQENEIESLKEQLSLHKKQLSEMTSTALRNSERLQELRKTKKDLELENHKMKASLTTEKEKSLEQVARSEALTKVMEEKYTKLLNDVDDLGELHKQLNELTADKESLTISNEALRAVVDQLKSEREYTKQENKKTTEALADTKKQLEIQELNLALLKRKMYTVEDQLKDAQTTVKESLESEEKWQEDKKIMMRDLDTAESKLDEVYKKLKLETEAKNVLENQTMELRQRLEETAEGHIEELHQTGKELETQRQRAQEYSEKVAELEKELGLKSLQMQETDKSLEVERTLNAKLYDDLYHLRQEHGKLQATHLKLSKQLQNQESILEEVYREREQALQDKATVEEALDIERTRLQTQLAQFTKLVDYRHNTPNPKKKGGYRKGLKLGRKKRDPEKDIDEWTKMRDIAKNSKSKESSSLRSPSIQSFNSVTAASFSLDSCKMTSTPAVRKQGKVREPMTPAVLKQGKVSEPMATPTASLPRTPMMTTSSLVTRSSVQKTGIKRAANDTSCVVDHNIPHKWSIKSGPFHKSHLCSTCHRSIKHTEKFAKCSYCSMVCHQQCVAHTPNSCGLPKQLAIHLYPTSPPKKIRSVEFPENNQEHPSNKENMEGVVQTPKMELTDQINVRPLSVDIVRCQSGSLCEQSPHNTTDLSITSSMLAGSNLSYEVEDDDSLV